MAPSPEQDKEPKAPDKSQSQASDIVSSDTPMHVGDSQQPSEATGGAPVQNAEKEEGGQLESLDERQLRTLLDEAANYRRPKDREGKSLLFKELLEKAEQDSEHEWGAPYDKGKARRSLGGGGGGGGRRSGNRPPLTHSGSLQDLAEGGGSTGGGSGSGGGGVGGRSGVGVRSKHRQGRASRQVSARSQQGGSLPSNVDQQHNLSAVQGGCRSFLEDVRCSVGGSSSVRGGSSSVGGGDYIATVHCVNPPAGGFYYTRDRVDSPPPHHYYTTEDLDIRSQPSSHVSVNYTSRATLEIGSPALDTDTNANSPSPPTSVTTNNSNCNTSNNNNNVSNTSNTSSTLTANSGDDNTNIGEDILSSSSNNNTSSSSFHSDNITSSSPTTSSPPLSSVTVASSGVLQLPTNYCSVKSVVGDEAPPAAHIMSQSCSAATTMTVTSSVSHPITTASQSSSQNFVYATCSMTTRPSDNKKSLDENGNAVQAVSGSGTSSNLKRSKKKKCKNETETVSNEIDGYRGEDNISAILKFIESDAGDGGKSGGKTNNSNRTNSGREGKSKDDSHEKGTKKRSTERRTKDGMDKLKKSNSMEELSRNELDDLTSSSSKDNLSLRKTKKTSAFSSDVSDAKRTDRRSWGNDGSDSYYHENNDDSLSINTSNSSSSQSSVSGQSVKVKKAKVSPRAVEAEPSVLAVETSLEAADFQTVTNKKKIRKRHSPTDEGRGKVNGNGNNMHGHGNHNNKNGRFNGSFNTHDKDTAKRNVERRHTPVSSPPSDSNDDLESVHSMCGEVAGEKVQASYADMARAASQRLPTAAPPAPAASPPPPPPPPNLVTPAPQRLHNFPDLIESCNYYSNERNIHDKYLDVSTENTKNLMLKESSPVETVTKTRGARGNIVDAGTQVETTTNHNNASQHPIYSHEQYPALEPRQRGVVNGKTSSALKTSGTVTATSNSNKTSVVVKPNNNNSSNNNGGKRLVAKANSLKDTCIMSHDNETSAEYYVAYVEHSATNNSNNNTNNTSCSAATSLPGECDSYTLIKFANSSNISNSNSSKMDNYNMSKPPDVVLPIASNEMNNQIQMTSDNNNRPPVIILNEELKKSSDNIRDIDGITFGFDINEQLLNGGGGNSGVVGDDSINNCNIDSTINNNLNNVSENATSTENSDVNNIRDNSDSNILNSCERPPVPYVEGSFNNVTVYKAEFPPIKEQQQSQTHQQSQQQQKARRSTSVCETSTTDDGCCGAGTANGVLRVGSSKTLRFLPPPDVSHTPKDAYNLERLVHYVGMAWEDTIKSPGGKVRYFSE